MMILYLLICMSLYVVDFWGRLVWRRGRGEGRGACELNHTHTHTHTQEGGERDFCIENIKGKFLQRRRIMNLVFWVFMRSQGNKARERKKGKGREREELWKGRRKRRRERKPRPKEPNLLATAFFVFVLFL